MYWKVLERVVDAIVGLECHGMTGMSGMTGMTGMSFVELECLWKVLRLECLVDWIEDLFAFCM